MDPNSVPTAKVRVQFQSGRDGTQGLSDAGGHIPSVLLRDTSGRNLGGLPAKGAKLGSDRFQNYDISIANSDLKTLEVMMETLSGDGTTTGTKSLDDGLCLAQFMWTPGESMLFSQDRKGVISGDLFYLCGYSWYYSGKTHNGYELRCGWLDGDNSNGNSVHGMILNTDILGSGYIESYSKNYPNPSDICYWGVNFSGGASPHSKRSLPLEKYGSKAYVTAGPGAIAICDSPTSWGPSMLSLEEGIFCDMVTKTKLPICSPDMKDRCVSYNSNHGPASGRARGQRNLTANKLSRDEVSFDSYELHYLVKSDLSGTVIDHGSEV
ncbi:hypothetical protein BGZ99_007702 [Dissophora globulifera]|uniref:Uncharacterized protein n=1 Tax=Dissophora globulifera TaxID=979702 RepID=A0A9P6RD44_9FUNG|nr:hypothetical protein BGZ99_007702 [Dissophora globulifera]